MSQIPNPTRKFFRTSMFGTDVKCERCCLLPDGRIFLLELSGNHGYVFDPENHQWDTIEFDYTVIDIALSHDKKSAVVSAGINGFQQIKLNNFHTKQNKKSGGKFQAVAAFSNKIVVHSDVRKLSVMDLNGEVATTINTKYEPWFVTTDNKGCIYWTNGAFNEVHCEQVKGPRRFIYHSTKLLCPSGLTLDKHGYVYVAGYSSHNIYKLSSDGQYQGEILQEKDGIKYPHDVVFNKDTDELIVLNDNGSAICIYKV